MEASSSPTSVSGDNPEKLSLHFDNVCVFDMHNKMLEYENEIDRLKREKKELKVIIETFSTILYKEG